MDLARRVAQTAIRAIARSSREGMEALCELLVEVGFSHAALLCLDPAGPCAFAGSSAEAPRWVGRELWRRRPAMAALRAGREHRGPDFRALPVFAFGAPAGGLVLEIRPGEEPPLPDWAPQLATALLERRARELASRRARHAALAARHRSASSGDDLERHLSRARHDLKAPLVPIKGYVDMMLGGMAGPLTPDMERFLVRTKEAVERLREMLEARLTAVLEPEVDLRGPISDAVAAQRRRGREVSWHAPPSACPARVERAGVQWALHKLLGGVGGTSAPRAPLEVALLREEQGWGIYVRGDAFASVPARTARLCRALLARSGAELLTAERGVKVRILQGSRPASPPAPALPSRRPSSPAAGPRAAAAGPD